MNRSQAFASDLSFESLQKRLRTREASPQLSDENRHRFSLPAQIRREAVPADHVVGMTEAAWTRRLLQRRQARLMA